MSFLHFWCQQRNGGLAQPCTTNFAPLPFAGLNVLETATPLARVFGQRWRLETGGGRAGPLPAAASGLFCPGEEPVGPGARTRPRTAASLPNAPARAWLDAGLRPLHGGGPAPRPRVNQLICAPGAGGETGGQSERGAG